MSDPGLHRRLGFGLLTLYGLSVMVGAGIYVLVGAAAGAAGALAPVAFLIAALVATPTAASYAELSTRVPEAGGVAAWLRAAFSSDLLALVAAVMIVGGAVISAATVLQGGVGYVRDLIPLPTPALTVVLAALLTAAAALGVVESLSLLAVATVAGIFGLLFVSWAGFAAPPASQWTAGIAPESEVALPATAGLAVATLYAFFAFIGFEDMVNLVEETRDPARTMPRAILAALAVTAALYALVVLAAVRAVPAWALAASDRPLALVVEAGFPGGAGTALSAVAAATVVNGVLAQIVMGARVIYGVARSVPALGFLAHAHPRLGTPLRATLLVGLVVTGVALTLPFEQLAAGASAAVLAVFAAINLLLIRLRRAGPPPPGAWIAPRWTPWAGAASALAALAASLWGGA